MEPSTETGSILARIDHSPDRRVYARRPQNARHNRGPPPSLFAFFYLAFCAHRKARFDPPAQGVRTHRAGDAIAFLAFVHQHQRRYAADPKPLLQARFLVGVHLHRLQPAGQLIGKPFDRRRDHPAGSAPGRPEVDQHRDRALLDNRGEIRRPAVSQPRQRLAASRAVRNAFGGGPDAGFLAAFGAGNDLGFGHRCLLFGARLGGLPNLDRLHWMLELQLGNRYFVWGLL